MIVEGDSLFRENEEILAEVSTEFRLWLNFNAE